MSTTRQRRGPVAVGVLSSGAVALGLSEGLERRSCCWERAALSPEPLRAPLRLTLARAAAVHSALWGAQAGPFFNDASET